MKKSIITLCIIFTLLLILTVYAVATLDGGFGKTIKDFFEASNNDETINADNYKFEKKVIAKAGNIEIYEIEFNYLKMTEPLYTDENIFEMFFSGKLVNEEAYKNGFTVTREEINEVVESTKSFFENHWQNVNKEEDEFYLSLKEFCNISNIDIDNFFDSDFNKHLIVNGVLWNKYKDFMLEKDNILTTDRDELHAYSKKLKYDLFEKIKDDIVYY